MSIFCNRKFQITAGIASFLVVSLAHQHLYAQPEPQQINTSNLSIIQSEKNIKTQSPLNETPLNYLTNQPISELNITQNTQATSIFYSVIDEWKKYKYSVNGKHVLKPAKLPTTKINFNQADLLTVLTNTRKYYQDYAKADPDISRNGLLLSQGVTVEDIIKTLDFMIVVLQEDISNNRATRLEDPNFINANFRVIKWSAYNPEQPKQKQLRITKYAVFTHPGSRTKTAKYNTPIYSLKENYAADNFYTKYSKQDVLKGIYEPGGKEFGKVEPLAYLTREGLEEALMQGTILINFIDGSKDFFNVDRNNGISYVRGLKATSQKRYWYFRKVDAIKGYGHNINAKISIKPGVTFAGDVLNIGLGRVIVMEYNQGGTKRLQMGVIADTGGAFLPNLGQLDFLAGIFENKKDFWQHIQQLPSYATAYILVKK
ncbi:hypothetical protein H6G54_25440 [Anabaena cylindrica FACHB-243]|uniref:POLO box domain-containing protein n=1 Tax=Anabaena cylindrica (strain ATCC 27899 / PCC 7122) TaxID=272123 RepID=K9ZDM5_ANACC|nr:MULTISPECIES: hypothetical protein [Anabaena]AFZ57313.1 hypothetical protein Anacy_1823 [Anabaena cylindrica PCC 7122]MBD2420981.1 hypothetical protein [Anabaena cylindrica FACHB-243]MBY5284739.1 hypothetical protein [Anabaena sp. CCAP 1446/1C]MBY5308345.1 hypothetical protein [Anabaena sp. CCAP 1446/1C]MCM2405734.1 hypothetical protein [Anabaena sp. CCAP 1446/1C]